MSIINKICGVQQPTGSPDAMKVFFLRSKKLGYGVGFVVEKHEIEKPTLTYAQLEEEVLNKIKTECEAVNNTVTDIARASAVSIPRQTRRGCGDLHENIIAYKGKNEFDAGIIVAHDEAADLYSALYPVGWENYYRLVV